MAVAAVAGNLPDVERSQLRLRVLACIGQQLICDLPWGCNPPIRKGSAMKRIREIEVQNTAVEICTIPAKQTETGDVGLGIHSGDQCIVLLFSGCKPESINPPIVRHADKLT